MLNGIGYPPKIISKILLMLRGLVTYGINFQLQINQSSDDAVTKKQARLITNRIFWRVGKSLGDTDLNLCPPSSFCRRGHQVTQLEHSVAHRFTPLYSKKGGGDGKKATDRL